VIGIMVGPHSGADICDIYGYDEGKVRRVQERMACFDMREMAHLFKVLADETRLRIACALCEEVELCVCDVAHIIGSSLATASHHLRLLRNMGIARYRRSGRLVFYSLRDERLRSIIHLVAQPNAGVSVGDGSA